MEGTLDPEIRRFLRSARGVLFPPLRGLPAGRLRATLNAALLSHDERGYEPEPVLAVERVIHDGVPTREYTPSADPSAVIVYFHGGGFVAGDPDTHDKTTRRIANGTGALVVSVDYRLAPEDPFPRPLDDAIAATRSAAHRHPHLPLIVMGDSAGGSLAASVAQWARDTGEALVAGQVLVYPVTEFDLDSGSARDAGGDYLLTRDDLALYAEYYLAGADPRSRWALPGLADEVGDLAPALVVLSHFDPLHDEGLRYANRMRVAGVAVEIVDHPGLIHGWLETAEVIHASGLARAALVDSVAALIERARGGPTHTRPVPAPTITAKEH